MRLRQEIALTAPTAGEGQLRIDAEHVGASSVDLAVDGAVTFHARDEEVTQWKSQRP